MTGVDRASALAAAGTCLADATRQLFDLPVAEAARRAYTPTGPSLAELEARIRARRAGNGKPVAA